MAREPARKPGLYWVKPKSKETYWVVAEWLTPDSLGPPRSWWYFPGDEEGYYDEDLDCIGPKVEPPNV